MVLAFLQEASILFANLEFEFRAPSIKFVDLIWFSCFEAQDLQFILLEQVPAFNTALQFTATSCPSLLVEAICLSAYARFWKLLILMLVLKTQSVLTTFWSFDEFAWFRQSIFTPFILLTWALHMSTPTVSLNSQPLIWTHAHPFLIYADHLTQLPEASCHASAFA